MLASNLAYRFRRALCVVAHLHVVSQLCELDVLVHFCLHVEHAEIVTKAIGAAIQLKRMLGQKFAGWEVTSALKKTDGDCVQFRPLGL
jgi:hypothetical protein